MGMVMKKAANPLAANDAAHMKLAHLYMRQSLDELQQVFEKDNILAHMVRVLGAMEETLYQYATPRKKGV